MVKPDHQSSIPGPHTVGGENGNPQIVLDLHTCAVVCVCMPCVQTWYKRANFATASKIMRDHKCNANLIDIKILLNIIPELFLKNR